MECAVDSSMKVLASAGNSGSPPFFCADTSIHPFTGYYDPLSDSTVSSAPFANEVGRIDVAGCCFWGRGILFNQGICDIGKFNHVYGLPAFMGKTLRFHETKPLAETHFPHTTLFQMGAPQAVTTSTSVVTQRPYVPILPFLPPTSISFLRPLIHQKSLI